MISVKESEAHATPDIPYQRTTRMKRIRFHIGSSIDSFPGNAIDLHLENPLRHIDHGPSSEDEDDADDAFSESNSKDIFPVVHPENPCYIADDISRHNDEK